jgi:hypothetical protein
LRHKHAAIYLKADGFANLDALAFAVGAVAINRDAVDKPVGKDGGSTGAQDQGQAFHSRSLQQSAGLTKPADCLR